MTLVLIVVFVALAFEYINGFHDTANSIAMGVSTRALTPRMALTLAAVPRREQAVTDAAVWVWLATDVILCELLTCLNEESDEPAVPKKLENRSDIAPRSSGKENHLKM